MIKVGRLMNESVSESVKMNESASKGYITDYIDSDELHRVMSYTKEFGSFEDYRQIGNMTIETRTVKRYSHIGPYGAVDPSSRYWKFNNTSAGWEVVEVSSDGKKIGKPFKIEVRRMNESVGMNESSDNDYQEFKKKCQANPTYKKAAAIAKKYGYRIADACYVDVAKNGNKFISFNVAAVDRRSYHPEIYYNAKYGNNYEFEIQTTAYGSMVLEEHTKFIKGVTDAHNMVAELSKLDLTTLEVSSMSE